MAQSSEKKRVEFNEIVEKLECLIIHDKMQPYAKLPGERILSDRWNCHRNTLRSALGYLEQIGIIYSLKNRGRFVSPQKLQRNLQDFHPLWYVAKNSNSVMESKVISFCKVKPTGRVRQMLKISNDGMVYRLCRIRVLDNQPVILETTYLSAARFKGLDTFDMEENSLFELLATEYDVRPVEGKQQVSIVYADELERDVLDVALQTPLFSLRGITKDDHGIPIEVFFNTLRSDNINFFCECRTQNY